MIRNPKGDNAAGIEREAAVAGEGLLVGAGGLEAVVTVGEKLTAHIHEDTHLLGEEEFPQETAAEAEHHVAGAHKRQFPMNAFPVMGPVTLLPEIERVRKAKAQVELWDKVAAPAAHIVQGIGKNIEAGEHIGVKSAPRLQGIAGTRILVGGQRQAHRKSLGEIIPGRYAQRPRNQVICLVVAEVRPHVLIHIPHHAHIDGSMPGIFGAPGRFLAPGRNTRDQRQH